MHAGHFGVKKTFARLSLYFLWPKMWGQVKQYVRSCTGCQKASRNTHSRAPLQPLPCVGEPFEKVAFDIVGPLPRTVSGNWYLLTMMHLFTKYPEAIPLRRVDNITILEAMLEIFARHGVPKVILTDQGSVFMSGLTKKLCETLEIEQVRTSPYHPQSDGALERWHACLKGMLKKTGTNLKMWDKQLKYLLFAYRDSPHCVTGFSPFNLLYGREVKGPLSVLQHAWLNGDDEGGSLSEWLVNVRGRMADMALLVSDRERKAKEVMKLHYDKKATAKVFCAGDMVLVRKPGLQIKLGDTWDGPYQVGKAISPVTYLIQVPGKHHKSKVLHSNLLKKWTTPVANIHRVSTFVEEEDCLSEQPPGLILARENFEPSVSQQLLLDQTLDQYKDVLCPDPGLTKELKLAINTGDNQPIRSHPYRIPPRWKDEVRGELDKMLALGIIQPSSSPWASSIITVGKKDGGVRICIDFRAVNNITLPDPY